MSSPRSALPVLAPKSPSAFPTKICETDTDLETTQIAIMSVCVACNNPLEVEIERDEDEEYDTGASSSKKAPVAAPETYPDDVQMTCGCHFHWSETSDSHSALS